MDMTTTTGSDVTSIGLDNAQAFLKSGQIWTSGCHAIGQSVATATQAHVEHVMAGWTAMSGVKSFKEAMEMQSSLMRASVENAVASSGKITGATLTLVEESVAPLTACMTLAAEKFAISAD